MKDKILIQSEAADKSTDDVLSWIKYLNPAKKVEQMFDNYMINSIKIELSNKHGVGLTINGKKLNKDTAFWYRRGELKFEQFEFMSMQNEVEIKIAQEYLGPILSFINGKIYKKGINKFTDNYLGKLEVLNICTDLQLSIPDTLITDNIEEVRQFLNKYKKIICKPVKNPFINSNYGDKSIGFYGPSELITQENLFCMPDSFIPCMFQEYIEKKIEIRTFFLFDDFFSMAIFSQNNPKTVVDYRNYDRENPNRNVPFVLPKIIEKKLNDLMSLIRLNCGSIDIIVTPENKFVFLEVNPIGQFQWLSRNCNYKIEKKIAEHLLITTN
jgi:ATP-GRASP peptide maturase of grasp-with-spasm system